MMSLPSNSATPSNRRLLLTVLVLGLLVAAAVPWILAKTTLRDRMLNAIVNSDDLTLTSTDASLGYLSPLSLSGLQIRSSDNRVRIEVPSIRSGHSWVGLLLARPELGTFHLDRPHVDVLLDPSRFGPQSNDPGDVKPASYQGEIQLPNLAAEFRDASVVVRTPESSQPPIDLKNIQLKLRIEQQADGPILRIDPGTVLDHQRITPELSGRGLQLIAPLLADEVAAEGEFSLHMKHFAIPLRGDAAARRNVIQVEGTLQLHQASASLRNTLARKVSELVLKLIGSGVPDRLTVARDLVVTFQVIDSRVHHEGLALLLPHRDSSIEFVSSGSVGLDESLDLTVVVKLPDSLLGGGALAQQLTKTPVLLTITGTLQEPKVDLARSGGLIDSIRDLVQQDPSLSLDTDNAMQDSKGDAISGAADALGNLLGELRQQAEQRRESGEESSILPNLLQRLRERPLFQNRRDTGRESAPAAASDTVDQEPVDL